MQGRARGWTAAVPFHGGARGWAAAVSLQERTRGGAAAHLLPATRVGAAAVPLQERARGGAALQERARGGAAARLLPATRVGAAAVPLQERARGGAATHLLPAGDGEDWTVVSLKRQKQPSAPGERQGRAVHVLSASRMGPDVSNSLQPGAGFRGAIHILSTRRGGVGRQLYLCGKDRGVESPLTYPLQGGIGRASAMPSGEGREAIAVHLHPVT